uniref:Signal sequence receptor subunit alpha n=1 Tax=Rhodosorus marinus TaxID=101924 RepID=A0A7S0BJP7_9RHOD|mmetsp:Transcript_19882/g.28959  ORF Transcript_19882/g.28959 Transcript_19882/m.28959 type:complete len:394 (+) Transcript_19882:166-1347(+)
MARSSKYLLFGLLSAVFFLSAMVLSGARANEDEDGHDGTEYVNQQGLDVEEMEALFGDDDEYEQEFLRRMEEEDRLNEQNQSYGDDEEDDEPIEVDLSEEVKSDEEMEFDEEVESDEDLKLRMDLSGEGKPLKDQMKFKVKMSGDDVEVEDADDVLEEVLSEVDDDTDEHVEPERVYDEFAQRYPLHDIPPPLSGISVYSTLGNENKNALTLGKETKSQMTFVNGLDEGIHVWGVMGSLNQHNLYSSFVQNFSYSLVNATIPPKSEFSVIYKFRPFLRLEPKQYQMALTVFYEKKKAISAPLVASYGNTYFNQTVELTTGDGTMDNQTLLLIVIGIVVLALGAFGAHKGYEIYTKRSSRVRMETGTRQNVEAEWVEEHEKMLNKGGRAKKKTN